MNSSATNNVRRGHSWIGILLFAVVVSLLSAVPANAEDCVAFYGGVIDGTVVCASGTPAADTRIYKPLPVIW